MEFKRFFAVDKNSTPEGVMPTTAAQAQATHDEFQSREPAASYRPTMAETLDAELQDAAENYGETAEIDVYEVTFKLVKSGRLSQVKQYKLE